MKEEPDIKAVTQEASLLVTKAAELFLEALTAEALARSGAGGAGGSVEAADAPELTYSDVGAYGRAAEARPCAADASLRRRARPAAAVNKTERLDFLRDVVPHKVSAATVLEGRAAKPE